MLDHWDNLDRSVERGYAGQSLWDWDDAAGHDSPRYRDYARANASIGINGDGRSPTSTRTRRCSRRSTSTKVAALADVFRPYGITVYLTARFSAPIEIGGLKTADPLDPAVREWWKREDRRDLSQRSPTSAASSSRRTPKGSRARRTTSARTPTAPTCSPTRSRRTAAVVMWRAFVYSNDVPADRVKQAYDEFKPLDGQFRDNVLVQVKNGPLDFQPREPFHPLFGAMPKTPLMMEFQITKEYLGQDTHLVYLGAALRGGADADTYAQGKGSTVAQVIDGSLQGIRADRDRRRGEHRHRPQLDRLAVQPGQLVRVRSPGVGSRSARRRDRRRVDADDVLERSRRRRARSRT